MNVYSSKKVEIKKLEDAKNAVLSGRWTEDNAGGCHLYDQEYEKNEENMSWRTNPKFHLRLHTTQDTEVKITLSRPEKAWKKKIAKDTVGCMIGLYVYEYKENQYPNANDLMNDKEFVPFNQKDEVSLSHGRLS